MKNKIIIILSILIGFVLVYFLFTDRFNLYIIDKSVENYVEDRLFIKSLDVKDLEIISVSSARWRESKLDTFEMGRTLKLIELNEEKLKFYQKEYFKLFYEKGNQENITIYNNRIDNARVEILKLEEELNRIKAIDRSVINKLQYVQYYRIKFSIINININFLDTNYFLVDENKFLILDTDFIDDLDNIIPSGY
ncbi:hypothetical protein LV84_03406 [Algoriphagus ratkowskyi]|uniref:Uncharacterized protein n=1 Tax=Algoriphagus ratkowskyi TaxID=57028 RepID=A0A2W7R0K7_9BACT|nr:hypothetical protein [Algoriphagus ratkowskyi]PZX52796.1 hypothetical protein LV84_03406 [Algoriphagus ratkowskyi]TXD76262.1 hypothetical protein ESW18_16915 [Algoriphagus ratkowskyi]